MSDLLSTSHFQMQIKKIFMPINEIERINQITVCPWRRNPVSTFNCVLEYQPIASEIWRCQVTTKEQKQFSRYSCIYIYTYIFIIEIKTTNVWNNNRQTNNPMEDNYGVASVLKIRLLLYFKIRFLKSLKLAWKLF